MREIIYRCWDKEKSKFAYSNEENGDYEFIFEDNTVKCRAIYNYCGAWGEDETDYSVLDCEVEQYSGMKDKNGDRIFDGDYLNIAQYPFVCDGVINYYGEVKWLDDEVVFALITHKCPNSLIKGISDGNAELLNEYDCDDVKIIGNIHDKWRYSNDKI